LLWDGSVICEKGTRKPFFSRKLLKWPSFIIFLSEFHQITNDEKKKRYFSTDNFWGEGKSSLVALVARWQVFAKAFQKVASE